MVRCRSRDIYFQLRGFYTHTAGLHPKPLVELHGLKYHCGEWGAGCCVSQFVMWSVIQSPWRVTIKEVIDSDCCWAVLSWCMSLPPSLLLSPVWVERAYTASAAAGKSPLCSVMPILSKTWIASLFNFSMKTWNAFVVLHLLDQTAGCRWGGFIGSWWERNKQRKDSTWIHLFHVLFPF